MKRFSRWLSPSPGLSSPDPNRSPPAPAQAPEVEPRIAAASLALGTAFEGPASGAPNRWAGESAQHNSDGDEAHRTFTNIAARGIGPAKPVLAVKERRKLKITGEITPGTTERLLSALAKSRRSGSLVMTSPGQNVRLEVLQDSLLVFESGNPEHRLGFLALEENLIDSKQLLAALKRQSTSNTSDFLGRLLLQCTDLEERALRWLLHQQARLVVESLENWTEGFFTFEEHDNTQLEERSPVLDERLDLERFIHRVGHTRGF